ncbi:mucin-5AC [Scaptodrosophila lebanonensis]|uniref:Mucin-5AC n=1 Tax=Drosophila lebanonensis TaxID=7225 RepID=A0A6J2UAV9_DROLE|nr:mucin-5AC [Scaptodrosophila lebanonensis]
MLTKFAKICILTFVIAPIVLGQDGRTTAILAAETATTEVAAAVGTTTATTTTASSAAAAESVLSGITNDKVKQNQTAAKMWPEMQRGTPTATTTTTTATSMSSTSSSVSVSSSSSSSSTSTATPTTTATTSTTTTTTTTTTAANVAATNGNEAFTENGNAKALPATAPKAEMAAMVAPTTTTTASTAADSVDLMMPTTSSAPTIPPLSNIKDTLHRIKLSALVTTTEIPILALQDEDDANNSGDFADASTYTSGADSDTNADTSQIQMQAAASYQVAETLADLNEEERARYGAMLAQQPTSSKLNIVDLYPMKLEDFQPILRNSNEQLLKERTVFTQPENAQEYRQNLMPNEVEMQAPPQLTVNQLTTTTKTTTTTMATEMPATSGSDNDFTGKLLADQDDLITEIERKFQLRESSTSTSKPSTPRPLPPLPPLAAGDTYIDRRVKKSFEFPLHRASDVMAMPHIDFANTKFNTDASDGSEMRAPAAAHPEFSTTKFYNSKELYNEMLLHNKRKLMKTATTITTEKPTTRGIIKSSAMAATAAASTFNAEELRKSSRQQKLQVIRTSDPAKLVAAEAAKATTLSWQTVAPATTTTAATEAEAEAEAETETGDGANTFRRVTLTPTSQSFAATTTKMLPTTTTTATAAEATTTAANTQKLEMTPTVTTTLKPKKYQKQLKRAKLLLKAILPPQATKTPADLDNLEVVGSQLQITSAEANARATKTTTTTAAAAAAATTTSTALPMAEVSTKSSKLPPSPSPSPSSFPSPSSILSSLLPPHRYTANPPKSASKPIARPRILSRLQEKINSLECEIQNVPQDSHLWRGNETHELLLPIVTTEHCKAGEQCSPNVVSWRGEAEIQSGDILIVEINDAMLYPNHEQNNTSSAAHAIQVYQVTRSGHEHCDVTEGVLLDITPLLVDGRKLVTLYDKDLTEGVNLLIVVSELWGAQCVRLKVTTKTDNCGENAECSSKGICYSNVAMEEYECQCCSGFAGPHCEEIDACNPSPCTNNGICVDLSQGHEGNSYQCLCPYGYAGKNCQYESDPCNPAECMNGGTCVGNSTHFRCDCTPGYTGPLCQHSLNECESSPCVHGICVDQEDGFRCFCQPGFAGELCNFEYNECESNPCQNGGECIDHIGNYECRCTKGYTGNRCQIKVDFCANKPCPEGHRCIDHGNDFSCECPGGRNGPDCNQMPRTYFQQCNVNPCTHGGTCWSSGDSFYCACRPGYTGTMCEDEFVVETVVSSSEFIVDDANARNFNDKTFGSSVVLKSPIELHNAYFAAGVLAAAIFIVAVVVTICHCKVNQTYRKFSTRSTSFIPILGFNRRPKMQGKLNKHWLSGKGLVGGAAAGAATGTTQRSSAAAPSQSTRHLPSQPNGSSSQTQTTLGGQLHERPFQRHLAMNLENDMYYTVDFAENSQHSPLIQ